MDIKGTIVLLNVLAIAIALTDSPVYRKFPCLVEKHRYFHKQLKSCRPCDRCLPGEGTDLTAQVNVHEEYGALKCRPCVQCEPGTYNTRRAFKCKSCRDCAASGRTVKTACAPDRKEVCGKRIKYNTTTTSEPIKILPSHHPPIRDRHPDRILETDYRNDGQTVLNNHTHINMSALAVALVFIVFIVLAVLAIAFYMKCYQGKHGCSLRQTNTISDIQPIVARSGLGHNTPSVVSEMQPHTPRPNRVSDGINNNIYPSIDHEVGDENAYGVPNTEHGYTERPFDQNSGTSSRERGFYTAIRQEELLSPQNMEHNHILSSDVEEDAASAPSNNLPPNDELYQEQTSSVLYIDNKAASKTVSDRENRKTDRKELEKYVRKLSRLIATKETYQTLGRHLNVSTTDIDIIKEEHNRLDERGYRTLRKWMECQPEAGIDDLEKSICYIGRKDILDKLRS